MKYLIFIIILVLSCCISYANFSYFEFKLNKYLVNEDEEVNVELKYSLSGYDKKDFLVRPVISNGIIEILNEDSGEWVSSYGSITSFPSLKENILVRVRGLSVEKTEIFFEIRNKNTGEIYLAPKKYVWGDKVYENYRKKIKLSKNDKENEEIVESNVIESSSSYSSQETKGKTEQKGILEDKKNVSKTIYLVLGIVVFFISCAFGYFYKKKRFLVNGKIH
ncbi:MAG: hypothetical protein WAX66_02500 [Patescibacteria group bacterium]